MHAPAKPRDCEAAGDCEAVCIGGSDWEAATAVKPLGWPLATVKPRDREMHVRLRSRCHRLPE